MDLNTSYVPCKSYTYIFILYSLLNSKRLYQYHYQNNNYQRWLDTWLYKVPVDLVLFSVLIECYSQIGI